MYHRSAAARRAHEFRDVYARAGHSPGMVRARLLPVAGCLAFLAAACSGASGTGPTGGSGGTGAAGAAGAPTAGAGGAAGASGGAGGSAAGGGAGSGAAGASGGGAGGTAGGVGGTGAAGGGGAGVGGGGAGGGGRGGASGGGAGGGRGGAAGSAAGAAGMGGAAGRGGAGGAAGTGAGAGGAAGTTGAGGTGGAATSRCNAATPAAGTTFVDATAGSDANNGATPATAWQTLAKVNATTFQPGNALCFKAGGAWTGALALKGSGSAAAPIVVDQFGAGAKPRIAAGTSDLQPLLLQNVQYWEINNLELTNDKSAPGDYRGISVRGRDVGKLTHIHIRNCFVHDVTGVVNWIGGDTADDDPPWVKFQTGWDASKRTGGIVVEVESASGTKTWFDDVVIENNVIQDTSFGGIIFKQLEGSYGWGVRSSRTDSKFTPHTNVVIRGNYLSQTGTPYGCNTIYVTGSQHVLIERNVTKDAGTSAIEIYNVDDARIQYNETFGTVAKAGGADSNGIDTDRATTGAIVQYNYVHDNGDGILVCQFAFGDSIIRYNVLINNKRHGINLHSDSAATNQTYNNLIMIDGLSSGNLIATSGSASETLAASYTIRNNILRSSRSAAMVVTGGGVTYANNLFSGVTAVGTASQSGDPMFVDGATHPNGGVSGPALSQLGGFKVNAGSLAIDKGVSVANNGGVDFWGGTLYVRTADIGPYEAP
jgi:hypothetical protein